MATTDYTKKISELKSRVASHAKIEDNNIGKSVIPKINTQSIFFYTVPLIIFVVLFFIMRPNFVCNEHIDQNNVITYKVSIKKVLIAGIITGAIISIGLFAYFRQKKT